MWSVASTVVLFIGFSSGQIVTSTATERNIDSPSSANVSMTPMAEILEEIANPSLEIHGFVSQGFMKTNANNYLANSKRGSFEFSEVGLNFTKQLADQLRVGMQLFARDLGPIGNYSAKFDWFYLDYRWSDWLGIRAGRVKLPFGLYNASSDADSARIPILLPQSVYPIQNRDFLLAATGGEIYGYLNCDFAGALDYRLYGGTVYVDANNPRNDRFDVLRVDVPYIVGGRLLWETPVEGLQLSGSVQALRLEGTVELRPNVLNPLITSGTVGPNFGGRASIEVPALLWVASLEYVKNDWLFAAEYSRWRVRTETDLPVLFPPNVTTSERGYVMASYTINDWVHPSAYYSVLFPDVDRRSGRSQVQNDFALTLRFDLNSFWLFKLEGHYMAGTAGLSSVLNDNNPIAELKDSWFVFLAKTTLHF